MPPNSYRLVLRRVWVTAAAVLASLALASCGGGSNSAGGGVGSGGTGSFGLTWSAPLLGGGTFDAASYAGKPVAFWFWAPT